MLYQDLPDIADKDLQDINFISVLFIPNNGTTILKENMTQGESFNMIFPALIPLTISPFLFIGIKRRPKPSKFKIAGNFYNPDEDKEFEVIDPNS